MKRKRRKRCLTPDCNEFESWDYDGLCYKCRGWEINPNTGKRYDEYL